ncbi:MAG: hypothetical protein Q4B77_05105 [Coriobacteriaceae bacterium]|nr:hypothetical protein [Coriobacteriaceae bacterium]
MSITTYQGLSLSYERAASLVPKPYLPAYQWFLDHENETGPRPWKEHTPSDMPITLVAQRGIHKPGGYRYAISITIANPTIYGTDSVHQLDDGTWVIQYSEHRHNSGLKPGSAQYNSSLINCLIDGIPVGVFYKSESEYLCLGLAFLESYNDISGTFTLHGPVHKQSFDSLSPVSLHEIDEAARKAGIAHLGITLESPLEFQFFGTPREQALEFNALAQRSKSTRINSFKTKLLDAYDGRCAISGYDTPAALDAIYVSSYLGSASVRPSSGILLRSDLGSLYQQSLISINPDTYEVVVGNRLSNSVYNHFDRRRIALPKQEEYWPSQSRLRAHHSAFLQLNS